MNISDIALLCLPGTGDEELFGLGETEFRRIFCNNGPSGQCLLHDRLKVTFYADRYEHAFRTSSDRASRAYDKDVVSPERIERLSWILPILEGKVWGVTCKEKSGPGGRKRAYYLKDPGYIIWLNPTKDKNWRFSSAYSIPPVEIDRVTHGFKTIWKNTKPKNC